MLGMQVSQRLLGVEVCTAFFNSVQDPFDTIGATAATLDTPDRACYSFCAYSWILETIRVVKFYAMSVRQQEYTCGALLASVLGYILVNPDHYVCKHKLAHQPLAAKRPIPVLNLPNSKTFSWRATCCALPTGLCKCFHCVENSTPSISVKVRVADLDKNCSLSAAARRQASPGAPSPVPLLSRWRRALRGRW